MIGKKKKKKAKQEMVSMGESHPNVVGEHASRR
jgi:hypothetical protein